MERTQRLGVWLTAVANHPFFAIILQLLLNLVLLVVLKIVVQNDEVRSAADVIILALSFFAATQTAALYYQYKRFITRDLIAEIVSSRGRTIERVQVQILEKESRRSVTELFPGNQYQIQFSFEGKFLTEVSNNTKLRPTVIMSPPLFIGDINDSNLGSTKWHGDPISINLISGSHQWSTQGTIGFNTSKINPRIEASSEVRLTLELRDDEKSLFTIEIASLQVHQMTKRELLSDLVELGILRKLPSGLNVLGLSPSYSTNLIVLSKRLHELKNEDRAYEDRADEIVVTLARIVEEMFIRFSSENLPKKLRVHAYDPEPSEIDLNFPPLIKDILSATNIPDLAPSKSDQTILLGLYQTHEFLSRLERDHALGICLFGFTPCIAHYQKVEVVFDLSKLSVNSGSSDESSDMDWLELDKLVDLPMEYFEKYAPALAKQLAQSGSDIRSELQDRDPSSLAESLTNNTRSLEQILSLVQSSADDSLKYGHFVISEPGITSYWVNLAIFANKLSTKKRQVELIEAIFETMKRCSHGYNINREQLSIVNLCSEHSGIANELPTLWKINNVSQTIYGIPCCNVVIDRKTNEITFEPEDAVSDTGELRNVILLVPIDSYARMISGVLEQLRRRGNNILCIVSLFSISKTWDYVLASDFFDVISLFRVETDPRDPIRPTSRRLTTMDDYRRLRPWLFEIGNHG